jgi:hypothetical protein
LIVNDTVQLSVPAGGLAPGTLELLAGVVLVALFGIGVAGALSRLLAHFTHRDVAWWATALLGAVILAAVFAPGVLSSLNASAEVRKTETDAVLQARDAAPAQTQRELADRVTGAISVTMGATDSGAAANGLVAAWHAGPRKADERGGGPLAQYLQTLLAWQYAGQPGPGGVRPNDTVLAEWGPEVGVDKLDEYGASLLKLPDGRALFPGATYRRLDVVLQRDGTRVPFATLTAVDDHGKWWLVGAQLP